MDEKLFSLSYYFFSIYFPIQKIFSFFFSKKFDSGLKLSHTFGIEFLSLLEFRKIFGLQYFFFRQINFFLINLNKNSDFFQFIYHFLILTKNENSAKT
jgi:hypothetical protein